MSTQLPPSAIPSEPVPATPPSVGVGSEGIAEGASPSSKGGQDGAKGVERAPAVGRSIGAVGREQPNLGTARPRPEASQQPAGGAFFDYATWLATPAKERADEVADALAAAAGGHTSGGGWSARAAARPEMARFKGCR